jgi:hypothetical protein
MPDTSKDANSTKNVRFLGSHLKKINGQFSPVFQNLIVLARRENVSPISQQMVSGQTSVKP